MRKKLGIYTDDIFIQLNNTPGLQGTKPHNRNEGSSSFFNVFCGGLIGLVSSHCRPPSSFFHAFFHPAPISCLVVQYQASCLLWFKVFRAGRLNRQRDDPIESRAHAFQPINAEEWAGPKGKPLLLLKEPLGALLQPHLSEPSV